MNFDKLLSVEQYLVVRNLNSTEYYVNSFHDDDFTVLDYNPQNRIPAINVSFPALENATSVLVKGNFSRQATIPQEIKTELTGVGFRSRDLLWQGSHSPLLERQAVIMPRELGLGTWGIQSTSRFPSCKIPISLVWLG